MRVLLRRRRDGDRVARLGEDPEPRALAAPVGGWEAGVVDAGGGVESTELN
jgi:hypothetical protein